MTSENSPNHEAINNPPSGEPANGSGGKNNAEKKGLLSATSKHAEIGLVAASTSPKFFTKKKASQTNPSLPASVKITALPLETVDLHPGDVLFEDYVVSGKVGSGRASIIYRVSQKSTGQIYACKTTKHQEVFVQHAFLKAAKTIMDLKHENLPDSIALMESPLGRPFYFLEFIDGVTLVELVDSTGPLEDIDEIAEIVLQVCDSLIYAHDHKIAHGDLTANNVMLLDTEEEIQVKVLDFGFANVLDEIDKAEGRLAADSKAHEERPFEDQIQEDIMMLAQVVIGIVTGTAIPEIPPTAPVNLKTTYDEEPNFPYGALEALLNKALAPELSWRFHSVGEFKTAFENWYDKASAEEEEAERQQQLEQSQLGQTAADLATEVAPKAARRSPRQTSVRLQVLELAHLRRNQVATEDSLALVLTGVFTTQGAARQSPVKTIATLTAKIVTATIVGILSLTFLILNWDKLGDAWNTASTQLSLALPGKHNEEIRRRLAEQEEEKALAELHEKRIADKAAAEGNLTASKTSATKGASPTPLPPEQKRFRYEEHPLYKNWTLRDVGAKRRLSKSRQ